MLATEVMESRVFDSFGEASAFARSLAQHEINHNLKRSGSSWLVEYDKSGGSDSFQNVDIDRLRRQIDEKDLEIERLKEQVKREREDSLSKIQKLEEGKAVLQHKLDVLQSHIEDEVAKRTEETKRTLENEKSELSEKLVRLRQEEDNFVAQKHKLHLLEKAYAECFGEAEVKIIKEKVTSKDICPRCGGDGGVRGGCQKCDGNGWIDVTEEKLREVVEIK